MMTFMLLMCVAALLPVYVGAGYGRLAGIHDSPYERSDLCISGRGASRGADGDVARCAVRLFRMVAPPQAQTALDGRHMSAHLDDNIP